MNDQKRPEPEKVELSDLTPRQRLRLTGELLIEKYGDEYLPPMTHRNRCILEMKIDDEIWREIHNPKKTEWEWFRDSHPVMKSAVLAVLGTMLGMFIWLIVRITYDVNRIPWY